MNRTLRLIAVTTFFLQACSSVAPIYLHDQQNGSKQTQRPLSKEATVEIEVVPRIGLFDELIYSCKAHYVRRIANQEINKFLPPKWDAVIPSTNARPAVGSDCPDTHLGNLYRRNLSITVRVDGKSPADGCRWTTDSDSFSPPLPAQGNSQSCVYIGSVNSNNAVPFGVQVGETQLQSSVPRDFLIVSMGDSYASGEGNPDGILGFVNGAPDPASVTWMSRRCHRSLWAGPIRAGLYLATQRLSSIDEVISSSGAYTVLSTACSGAELRDLTTRGYPGRETLQQMSIAIDSSTDADLPSWIRKKDYVPERRLAPQVNQISEILAGYKKSDGIPQIDALILSVGGNDINFGQLIVGLVTYKNPLTKEAIANSVKTDIDLLGDDFRHLETILAGSLSVDRVLLTGYPDPTILDIHHPIYCDCHQHGFLGLGLVEESFLCITNHESKAASESVIKPLNDSLRTIAGKFGWLFVPGIEDALVAHAWCQDASGNAARYIRTFADSMALQGTLPGTLGMTTGAMHPSANGHEKAYMKNIVAVLENPEKGTEFEIRSPHVKSDDGYLIVPPTLTLGWRGALFQSSEEEANCGTDSSPKDCPVVTPQVWWNRSDQMTKSYLAPPYEHYQIDRQKGSLELRLTPPDDNPRELLIKARDAVTKAIQPTQNLGRLRVDTVKPEIIECCSVFPDGMRTCPDGSTWLRADGLLKLSATTGPSGFGRWRCEGDLAPRCGNESTLLIDGIPVGTSTLTIAAENHVGVESESRSLTVLIDGDAPEISTVNVLGTSFAASEDKRVLTRRSRLIVDYLAEDTQSGVKKTSAPRMVSGIGRVPSPDCVHELAARHVLKFEAARDGLQKIEVSDCAVPSGNTTHLIIKVIRPLHRPSGARTLNAAQWQARLAAEPAERDKLAERLALLSPRLADLNTIADTDHDIVSAWLNLISGRAPADGPGRSLTCHPEEGPQRMASAFALVKAIDRCLAKPKPSPNLKRHIIETLKKAKLLP